MLKTPKYAYFNVDIAPKCAYIDLMLIGKRLRTLISSRGLKQKWVAERAGINENSLQRILDDRGAPSVSSLAKIAEALGVSSDYLLGLKDEAS